MIMWRGLLIGVIGLVIGFATYAGVSVTPLLLDLNMPPGSSYKGVLKVQNTGTAPINIEAIVAGFWSSSSGVPRFLFGAEGEVSYPYSGKDLLTIEPQSAVLQAGETKEFTYIVHFPILPEPFGGRYVAALFEATPVEEGSSQAGGSSIKVATRVACLFLLRPSEAVVSGTKIFDFKVGGGIESIKPRLTNDGQRLVIYTLFKNTGNIHVRPEEFHGTITILNAQGDQMAVLEIEPHNILPDTEYNLKNIWDLPDSLEPGVYTLKAKIELTDPYGEIHAVESVAEVELSG